MYSFIFNALSVLLLMQEDDLPIQLRDCSSNSPAPLRKVNKKTRGEVNLKGFHVAVQS